MTIGRSVLKPYLKNSFRMPLMSGDLFGRRLRIIAILYGSIFLLFSIAFWLVEAAELKKVFEVSLGCSHYAFWLVFQTPYEPASICL